MIYEYNKNNIRLFYQCLFYLIFQYWIEKHGDVFLPRHGIQDENLYHNHYYRSEIEKRRGF